MPTFSAWKIKKIAQLSESLKAIYIYFNNAAEAFAVRNVISLHEPPNHHILQYRHVQERLGRFESATYSSPANLIWPKAGYVMILENNLALISPVITSYHVKQSGLTSPIGPNQPQHLPSFTVMSRS